MNKIVFAMYDAETANAVASALPLLAAKFDVTVIAQQCLAYPSLLKKLEFRERTHFKLIEVESFPMETAREFLLEEKPCAVVTAISNFRKVSNKVDFTLPEAAAAQKIPVIGIFEPAYLSPTMIEPRLNFERSLPQKIIVSSSVMKGMLTRLKLFAAQDIVISPMPKYSDYLVVRKSPDLPELNHIFRRQNQIDDNDFALVFTSSAHSDDIKVVDLIAEAASRMKFKTLLTFHSKDKPEFQQYCLQTIPNSALINYGTLPELKALTALSLGAHGAVCSLKCSLMFDVAACGGNTISINPNHPAISEDAGTILGITRGVDSADTLLTALDDVRTGGLAVSVVFPEYNRAPADFANLLEQLLKEVR